MAGKDKNFQPPFLYSNSDYAVINGDLSQAAAEMIVLFRSFRLRTTLLEQTDLLDWRGESGVSVAIFAETPAVRCRFDGGKIGRSRTHCQIPVQRQSL